jgi:protein gp37
MSLPGWPFFYEVQMPTQISWTDETWNPITGCTKFSIGCKNCYAYRMAGMFKREYANPKYRNGVKVTTHPSTLNEPLAMKKPRKIFVCSMSDLFHAEVPTEFIEDIFSTMTRAHWHTFILLTKRSRRLAEWPHKMPRNVWPGVSVETQKHVTRIDDLRQVDARVRVVSFEPLVGPINEVDLTGIGWVIVGGETGMHSRKMEEDWAKRLLAISTEAGVPFYFKQWGGGQMNEELEGTRHQGSPHTYNEQSRLF